MGETKKTKKKKGPIRFEAIIPITIIFALIFAYFALFFDTHLRWGMEWAATRAHGAEVNIDYVNTNFLNASMAIGKIQVTNKKNPEFNIIQIGKVSFRALWDGILRGKIVIPLASITDIQINTKRKSKGYVLPPKKGSGNMMKTMKNDALTITRQSLSGNIFGDVADVLQGTDYKEKLKEMEGQLKTSQFINTLETELKKKEELWKERIKNLPKDDYFKQIEARAKAIKVDSKDPTSYLKAAKEIDSLYKEVDSKIKAVKDSKDALSSDMKQYKNIYADIESYIDKDLNDLQAKLGLPSIDPKDIALKVFGRQIEVNIQNVERYMRVAREYMPPPKKDRAQTKIEAPTRAEGRDYQFPKKKSYPKFWLQKAEVSSQVNEGGFSGAITGVLLNFTDNPKHLGKPAEIKLSGEFPKSDIFGAKINVVIDHTTDNPKEFGTIAVNSYPLKDVILSKSSDVTYGFDKAIGQSQLDFKLENETISLDMNSTFDKIDYMIQAEKEKVKELLANISNSLGALTLRVRATGSWSDLDLSVRSNLGERLGDALKQEFSNQVAKYKKQLRDEIDKKISGEKQKLMAEVNEFEKKIGIPLKNKEAAIASLKQKLDAEKDKAKSKQEDKLKEAGKKLLKGLFK